MGKDMERDHRLNMGEPHLYYPTTIPHGVVRGMVISLRVSFLRQNHDRCHRPSAIKNGIRLGVMANAGYV